MTGVQSIDIDKFNKLIEELGFDDGWGKVTIAKAKLEQAIKDSIIGVYDTDVIKVTRCKHCEYYHDTLFGEPCTGYCGLLEMVHKEETGYCDEAKPREAEK